MRIKGNEATIKLDDLEHLLNICATITDVSEKNLELHKRIEELEDILSSKGYLSLHGREPNRVVKQSKMNDEE